MIIDGLVLGAYALEPPPERLPGGQEQWYRLLAEVPGAGGVEVPFRGGALHPEGPRRLAALLPAGWSVVVTMLPATMAGIRAADGYGLASPDDAGRRAALADARAALDAAAALADAAGRDVVRAIHLTSAPRGADGSGERLAASLIELAPHARGVLLTVEHCDAWRPDGGVQKGFLPLDAEIAAVRTAREATGAAIGQTVNWGRSVIDERDAAGGARQLDRLAEAGTLAGLMVSGASATGGATWPAWADAHNPLDTADPSSLLTAEVLAELLAPARRAGLAYLGVKVQDPRDAADPADRIAPLAATVDAVRRAEAAA
jgi:hypothetical protein